MGVQGAEANSGKGEEYIASCSPLPLPPSLLSPLVLSVQPQLGQRAARMGLLGQDGYIIYEGTVHNELLSWHKSLPLSLEKGVGWGDGCGLG